MSLVIGHVSDLRVGDIGFTSIRGRVGAAILAAQTGLDVVNLLRSRRAENAGWITHAYLVTAVGEDTATIVEAMPSGARTVMLVDNDRCGRGYAYARLPLTPEQAAGAAASARQAIGTPYSFADYAALTALHLGLPHALLRSYVTGSGRMICSQMCDWALCSAGVHLFDDGRLPQDVTPGALWWRAAQLGTVWVG